MASVALRVSAFSLRKCTSQRVSVVFQVTGDGWGILQHDKYLNNHRDHLGYRCVCASLSSVLTPTCLPIARR